MYVYVCILVKSQTLKKPFQTLNQRFFFAALSFKGKYEKEHG